MYSFDGPFQLLYADVENLEVSDKSAADPKYCLLFVDLFTSKVYVYPMESRLSIISKKEICCREVEPKRKGPTIRLQTVQEFKQREIFDLNKKYKVNMSLTVVRDGKTFGAE